MTKERISFLPNQKSGLEELAGGSPMVVNCIVDKLGAVRRRPAIAYIEEAPESVIDANGIDGVYVTNSGRIFAVGKGTLSRNIYSVANGIATNMTSVPGSELSGEDRPTFAETESIVAIAGGDSIQKVVLSGGSERLSSESPFSTHVLANASRLAANNRTLNRGRISYSGLAAGSSYSGFEDWTSEDAGFVTAEARPDPVVALHENTNEIFAFGTTNLQVFVPDASLVYSPIATKEYGCIAPYSVVKVDQNFFWLDDKRRFVMSDGRSFKFISDDIQQSIEDIETVSDAFGYRVKTGIVDAVVWTFPSDGRSFVYQIGAGWGLWMGWDEESGNYSKMDVTCASHNPKTSRHIVGTSDGKVGRFVVGPSTDIDDKRIPFEATTGYNSYGTDSIKVCKGVTLALKRGKTTSSVEPVCFFSWRDDGGEWNPPHEIGLGLSGDYEISVRLRSLGTYRHRQWKFSYDGTEELTLISAIEEFEIQGV